MSEDISRIMHMVIESEVLSDWRKISLNTLLERLKNCNWFTQMSNRTEIFTNKYTINVFLASKDAKREEEKKKCFV